MDALQTLAAQWVDEHPEFHDVLSDAAWALKQTYPVEAGHANPFLHLSMHLSIDAVGEPTQWSPARWSGLCGGRQTHEQPRLRSSDDLDRQSPRRPSQRRYLSCRHHSPSQYLRHICQRAKSDKV